LIERCEVYFHVWERGDGVLGRKETNEQTDPPVTMKGINRTGDRFEGSEEEKL
jgi:hypothetical protein